MEDKSRYNFSEWPLDLLIDYVIKIRITSSFQRL